MINDSPESNYLSRRDFLKVAGSMAGALALSSLDFDNVTQKGAEYVVQSGVPVYGLENPLTGDRLEELLDVFDFAFESRLTMGEKNLSMWSQREKLLPRNERLLQFIVRESVYKSFENRKAETGLGLTDWLKLHVEAINLMIKNSDFPIDLKIVLDRLIIVDDLNNTNPVRYTKDIDAMWFLDNDYRDDQTKVTNQSYFWSANRKDEGVEFKFPAGGSDIYKEYFLKSDVDFLGGIRDGVWLDFGLVHELIHQALNLPDEYVLDDNDAPFKFKNVEFRTGSFHEPHFSPYASLLLGEVNKRGIRGYYMDPRGIGLAKNMEEKFFHFGLLPKSFKLKVFGMTSVDMFGSTFALPDYYSKKEYKNKTSSIAVENTANIDVTLFPKTITDKGVLYSTENYIKFNMNHGDNKELFFPIAILNMIKMSGTQDSVLEVQFDDRVSTKERTTQFIELIPDLEIENFLAKREKDSYYPYAKAKIPGINIWVIWSLQK